MSLMFEEDDLFFEDEWAEISDMNGKRAVMRHLATIHHGDRVYHVLGAVREEKPDERALMLIREQETADGSVQHVIVNNRDEIEQVVRQFVGRVLAEHMQDMETVTDLPDACGHIHLPGEFCYCDDPEYLQ